jgi:arsenical pump membrane protein
MVALAADVVLVVMARRVPWRDIPTGTAAVVLSLGILASAAAVHLPVHRLLSGTGTLALARSAGLAALAANLVNNLPALLVALPVLGRHPGPVLWAVLVGVNMGPALLVTGSLASLLWLDTLGRLGVRATAGDFTRVGWQVALPAAAAGAGVLLGLRAGGLVV